MTAELLLRHRVDDPLQIPGCVLYLDASGYSYKSGDYKLHAVREGTTIEQGTAGGRPAYRFVDDLGPGYRLEYALQDYAEIPTTTCDFHFGIWTYCGPQDFNKTMTGTGSGCVVGYMSLAPLAYASSRQSFYSDYDNYHDFGGRMYTQLAVGRGSNTSSLRVCCQRADQTGASVTNMNTQVSGNFTKSQGWHYVWVQTGVGATPKSTIVMGLSSSDVSYANFWNNTTDWDGAWCPGWSFNVRRGAMSNLNSVPWMGPAYFFRRGLTSAEISSIVNTGWSI